MLVVNKMDVAEAQFKYDEVKDKLRHLSGKFLTLLNLQAAFRFCDTQSSSFFSQNFLFWNRYLMKTRKFVQNEYEK